MWVCVARNDVFLSVGREAKSNLQQMTTQCVTYRWLQRRDISRASCHLFPAASTRQISVTLPSATRPAMSLYLAMYRLPRFMSSTTSSTPSSSTTSSTSSLTWKKTWVSTAGRGITVRHFIDCMFLGQFCSTVSVK